MLTLAIHCPRASAAVIVRAPLLSKARARLVGIKIRLRCPY